jgi:hypothetical protein
MLRLLCVVACLLASVKCFANDYIRVTGQGTTVIEAKNNAFKQAIQTKVGLVVISELESNTNNLTRDNISLYSAGYIDDYRIVSTNSSGSFTRITMDVLVAPSKLIDQTLNRGKVEDYIDGTKLSDKINSYRTQKSNANTIISTVLSTYPQNAYVIKTKAYSVVVDKNQNAVLEVPYRLNWNYDYIVAFNEALKITQDNKFNFMQKAPANVVVMAKDPKDYVLGNRNHYQFNDIPMVDDIKSLMSDNREVRIKMVLRDRNNLALYSSCWIPDSVSGRKTSFYSLGQPNNIIIYGNEFEENVLRATIDPKYEWILEKMITIEVAIVPHSNCQN